MTNKRIFSGGYFYETDSFRISKPDPCWLRWCVGFDTFRDSPWNMTGLAGVPPVRSLEGSGKPGVTTAWVSRRQARGVGSWAAGSVVCGPAFVTASNRSAGSASARSGFVKSGRPLVRRIHWYAGLTWTLWKPCGAEFRCGVWPHLFCCAGNQVAHFPGTRWLLP